MKRHRSIFALALMLIVTTTACGGDAPPPAAATAPAGSEEGGAALPAAELALVAYSTPQEAYDRITEAFSQTPEGRNITFTRSYGGSGDQSRAVESGLAADIVAFSLEPDMTRLVKAGMVAEDWNRGAGQGMVTRSVAVLVVRKGNPKNIQGWNDLIRPGVQVVTPNPFTSGGARWNVMAAFGQVVKSGGTEEDGVKFLNDLFANVPVQDDTARKSLQTFTGGVGDALIAYENEAIFAQQNDQPIDYIVPKSTILIENPVAVTSNSKHPEQAQAFLDYLKSPAAQKIFAENGYRPVAADVQSPFEFPEPDGLFTIADFGGWATVSDRFFNPDGGIMADVERNIGVSVG